MDSMLQVHSVTCFVQAVKDVLETAALFSFASNNIPSWPEIILLVVETKTFVLIFDVCWNPLCGGFPG